MCFAGDLRGAPWYRKDRRAHRKPYQEPVTARPGGETHVETTSKTGSRELENAWSARGEWRAVDRGGVGCIGFAEGRAGRCLRPVSVFAAIAGVAQRISCRLGRAGRVGV